MIHAIKILLPNQRKFPQHALINLNILAVSLKAVSSIDIPFLKLFSSVTSLLLVCRCWLNILCIVYTSPLEKTVNNELGL